jgi:hypothetical protein
MATLEYSALPDAVVAVDLKIIVHCEGDTMRTLATGFKPVCSPLNLAALYLS